ncbi:hypothetical protein, partial [Allosalinactinospora lopnorensis]|uniref:hypothetical protein n=1 Tax=Allosalinactinospora lopnorensis TaxID=1352348 RepID=UPI00191C18BF
MTTSSQAFAGESPPPDDGGNGATEAVLARLPGSPLDQAARQWAAAALHEDGDAAVAACARGEAPP